MPRITWSDVEAALLRIEQVDKDDANLLRAYILSLRGAVDDDEVIESD